MYEFKKRQSKFKRFFLMLLLIVIVAALSIFIYNMYISTEIYSNNSSNYETKRLSTDINIKNEGNNITEILDKTIKCVVGISKIKNTGNSIFLNDSTKELGLGTGIILTDNRIYPYKFTCCRK